MCYLQELRVAPGVDGVDFSQTVLLRDILSPSPQNCPHIGGLSGGVSGGGRPKDKENMTNAFLKQDYEPFPLPTGMLWTVVIHENWNDAYFVGLDRLMLYDAQGVLIDVEAIGGRISALPHSLQVLSAPSTTTSYEHDPRTPRKLITTPSVSTSTAHSATSWLAPLSRCMTDEEQARSGGPQTANNPLNFPISSSYFHPHYPLENTLYIAFDCPISVSYIKLYNYSKTPARGVKEFSIYCDTKLIFMGTLKSGTTGVSYNLHMIL